ncbi:unnamed protein product [Dovyalis caffra]|uniref:Uncharacterized protein n=1 Tax=Dovyalis caffra TaxID=77055 RepID=A0AAV1S1B2_9ROSI|nr:unnamed protein product [Dovyalis caffra]
MLLSHNKCSTSSKVLSLGSDQFSEWNPLLLVSQDKAPPSSTRTYHLSFGHLIMGVKRARISEFFAGPAISNRKTATNVRDSQCTSTSKSTKP